MVFYFLWVITPQLAAGMNASPEASSPVVASERKEKAQNR